MAFADVPHIEKKYYCGTREQWNVIAIGEIYMPDIYFYSEDKPSSAFDYYWHYDGEKIVEW